MYKHGNIFALILQLAFDAMLLKTGAQLELLTCPDMVLFLQQSVRGGVSFVNDRYLKFSKDEKLLYTDAINLYGWAQVGAKLFQCRLKY